MNIGHIEKLYRKHARLLNQIKTDQRRLLVRKPRTDDIEAEIACMLCAEHCKDIAVEMSPNSGWSTGYLLRALRPNACLWSFDTDDTCSRKMRQTFGPSVLQRWTMHNCDVREHYGTLTSGRVDFLFIDCDHSREFAQDYVERLLKPIHAKGRTVPVYVHDVYHQKDPSEEGEEVLAFLARHGIEHATASWFHEDSRRQVDAIRKACIDCTPILDFRTNSAIFFYLGAQP